MFISAAAFKYVVTVILPTSRLQKPSRAHAGRLSSMGGVRSTSMEPPWSPSAVPPLVLLGEAHAPCAKLVREMRVVAPVPTPPVALLRKGKPGTVYLWVHIGILGDLILMTSMKNILLNRKLKKVLKTIILCDLVMYCFLSPHWHVVSWDRLPGSAISIGSLGNPMIMGPELFIVADFLLIYWLT